MRWVAIGAGLILMAILALGCNKNKDRVAKLEKEVREAESKDYITDNTGRKDSLSSDTIGEIHPEETPMPDRIPNETDSIQMPKEETTISAREFSMVDRTPSPSGKGIYTVQVASGTDLASANEIAGRFVKLGYKAFVSSIEIKGVTYYRVRIGNFGDYREADKLGKGLRDKYLTEYWIDKIF
ncbi:MAG: SPOR domain-containing protein [candidate division Zixibacteria bacterium]|nr:SPOR domain-containing protein [candidate division Zixibacteria bacterium]